MQAYRFTIISNTLFLAVVLALSGVAQTKTAPQTSASPAPQAYLVNILHVQPGMTREFLAFTRNEMLPVMKKAGMTQMTMWRTATFGNTGEFIMSRPVQNMAGLDDGNPIAKAIGQDAYAALMAKASRLATIPNTFMIISRPDLGIAPATGYVPKLAVMAISSVSPGRNAEFEKYSKEGLSVMRKTNCKGILAFKRGLGGDPNEYASLVLFDSFADLSQFPAALSKAAAETKSTPMPTGVVVHTEWTTVRLDPELSIMPAVAQ
jgi:heme-degrading monooxygenase HmoA